MCSGRGSCCWPADGWSNRAIGVEVGLHYNQVAVWRDRYRDEGAGRVVDSERPGRPPVYDADDVILLVKTATETPPQRWSGLIL
jgi:transposase